MKDNSKMIFNYVKGAHEAGAHVTAQDICEETGLTIRQVIGSVNAFVKKELMVREEKQVLNEDTGKYETYKFIEMTPAGLAFDPEAE